jgi:TonB family protein
MPAIAQEMGFKGSASIQIEIAPNGKLVAARVAQTSGNRMVDAAALSAAKSSTFRSATVNRESVGGAYLLVADLNQ